MINKNFYLIYTEYDSLRLNIDPILYFQIIFKIPIFYYINSKKYETSIWFSTKRVKHGKHKMELRCPEEKKNSDSERY